MIDKQVESVTTKYNAYNNRRKSSTSNEQPLPLHIESDRNHLKKFHSARSHCCKTDERSRKVLNNQKNSSRIRIVNYESNGKVYFILDKFDWRDNETRLPLPRNFILLSWSCRLSYICTSLFPELSRILIIVDRLDFEDLSGKWRTETDEKW